MNNKFLDQDRQIPIDPTVDTSAMLTGEGSLNQTLGILAVDNMYLNEQDSNLLKAVSERKISHHDAIQEIIKRERQHG